MRKKLLLFCFLFFFIRIDYAYAQLVGGFSHNYSIRHYTDEQGLPQNSVRAIFQDELGFIWLATEGGVVRFDGETFRTYEKSIAKLSSNRIVSFVASTNTKKMPSYAVTNRDELIGIRNGAIWEGRSLKVQDYIPRFVGEWKPIKYWSEGMLTIDLKLLRTNHYIIPTSLSSKASYYECSDTEISYFSEGVLQQKNRYSISGLRFFFRFGDALYAMTGKGGIVRMMDSGDSSNPSDTVIKLTGDIEKNRWYGKSSVDKLIYSNGVSNQVFVYFNQKCYQIVKREGNQLVTQLIISDLNLKEMNINTIWKDDSSGKLFLGSLTNGLYVLERNDFQTVGLFSNQLNDVYYAQTQFKENRVVVPNGRVVGKSLAKDDAEEKWIRSINSTNRTDNYSILTDKNGFIWTKSGNLVHRFSSDGSRLLNQWNLKGRVSQIYEGKDSRIWVGVDTQGLYCFDISSPTPIPMLFLESKHLEVSYLNQIDDTILWIGTVKGLFRFNLINRQIGSIPGTTNFFIRSLYTKSESEVWFTTEQSGFYLYLNGTLKQFPLDKNGYMASAHCILEDQKGFFGITTNRGIFQISRADLLSYFQGKRKDLFYMHYTKNQGLLSNEFNGGCEPCGIRLKNGFFSLPSMKGLVWFIPENISPDLPNRDIRLDNIDLQGEVKEVNSDTILLPENPERVRLVFTVPYFGNRENVSLFYKLVPGDYNSNDHGKWIKMDKMDLTLYLSSLHYGTYTLCVRKLNGFGENNFGYKFVTILVPPQWFETWWFKFLGVVLVLVGAFVLNRLNGVHINSTRPVLGARRHISSDYFLL